MERLSKLTVNLNKKECRSFMLILMGATKNSGGGNHIFKVAFPRATKISEIVITLEKIHSSGTIRIFLKL